MPRRKDGRATRDIFYLAVKRRRAVRGEECMWGGVMNRRKEGFELRSDLEREGGVELF